MSSFLFCGDRHWNERNIGPLYAIMTHLPRYSRIISGGAKGVDTVAHILAESDDTFESVQYFAEWGAFGRKAGPIRNRKQYDENEPLAVFAFHDNLAESSGTKDMVLYALDQGCPYVYVFDARGRCYIRVRQTETWDSPFPEIDHDIAYAVNDPSGFLYKWDADKRKLTWSR